MQKLIAVIAARCMPWCHVHLGTRVWSQYWWPWHAGQRWPVQHHCKSSPSGTTWTYRPWTEVWDDYARWLCFAGINAPQIQPLGTEEQIWMIGCKPSPFMQNSTRQISLDFSEVSEVFKAPKCPKLHNVISSKMSKWVTDREQNNYLLCYTKLRQICQRTDRVHCTIKLNVDPWQSGRNVFLFCGLSLFWVSLVGSTVAGSLDTTAQGQLHLTGFLSGIRKYLWSEGDSLNVLAAVRMKEKIMLLAWTHNKKLLMQY